MYKCKIMLYLLLFGLFLTVYPYSFLNEYNKIKMDNQNFPERNDIFKGVDMRYPLKENIDDIELLKIFDNIKKKKY